MAKHAIDLTLDEQIDAALERSRDFDQFPSIIEAAYRADPGWECLRLRLSNGRLLMIPRQMLSELGKATPEQAQDVHIGPQGLSVWWPQLDDGLYLPDFLEHRWGRELEVLAA
jgi:hypothetical protein